MLNINPTKTKSWLKLYNHFNNIKNFKIKDLFLSNPNRFKEFSIYFKKKILFDYSKNIFVNKTLNLFISLLKEIKFNKYLFYIINGGIINVTEKKYVLNFLFRDFNNFFIKYSKYNYILLEEKKKIDKNLIFIKKLTYSIIKGIKLGFNNKKIINIVNIGIGGSDLGPRMIVKALNRYKIKNIKTFFVSNIDIEDINNVLNFLIPENTLFIICSKTFTTQETILNFKIACKWILNYFNNDMESLNYHFILVTSNLEKALTYNININNIFVVSDWVSGRFSFCSAFGLIISLALGYKNFIKILKGAHDVDKHFFFTDYKYNIPIILAILNIWYSNFFKFNTKLVLVYNELLSLFPLYLQQLIMESNGKSVDRNNNKINNYFTSSIIWNGLGTVCQHSFFQLLHQGTYIIPIDFIVSANSISSCNVENYYDKLMSNILAQSQSLAFGDYIYYKKNNLDNYKSFIGNKPNNFILLKEINPYILGSLLTFYEYKVLTEGIILNICSYDQWGVELGKNISNVILEMLLNIKDNNINLVKNKKIFLDDSTLNLIKIFNKFRKN